MVLGFLLVVKTGQGGQQPHGLDSFFHGRIAADLPVPEQDHAFGKLRDVGLVSHQKNGDLPPFVQALEDVEDIRKQIYDEEWERGGLHFLGSYNDLVINKKANDTAAEFFREKIRSIIRNQAVADRAPSV